MRFDPQFTMTDDFLKEGAERSRLLEGIRNSTELHSRNPNLRPICSLEDTAAKLVAGYPDLLGVLPPFSCWSPLELSEAWFSQYHWKSRAFSLPFYPGDFVYSPKVSIVMPKEARSGSAHYASGVQKYVRLIERGVAIPPVTIVCRHTEKGIWTMMDGNHRFEASVICGAGSIPAVFALPKEYITS